MADRVMTMTENNEPSSQKKRCLVIDVNMVILVVQRLNNYDDVDIYARLRFNKVLNCALSLSFQVCVPCVTGCNL